MKRVLTAVLLCLLVLLCGCTRQPEAEPPAQEAVSVSPVPVQENDPASVEQKTEAQDPVPIPDGIVKINGLAIYYQNGQPLAGTGLTELDGQLLYVQPDGSLPAVTCYFDHAKGTGSYLITQVWTVTCDEGNETYYARDGRLYQRADNALVQLPYGTE